MKAALIVAFLSALGAIVSTQYAGTVFPYYQKNGQVFPFQEISTPRPQTSTTISLSPQTSVSVQHTIVRNKPAYPYPYTESTLHSEASEDSSYYYTNEDTSEETGKTSSTTPMPTTSTAKTVRSFWNSQKAQLDARRKEGAQKFLPTYSKPTSRAENKPKIEFKVREKPKFGLASKNKDSITASGVKADNSSQNTPTTTIKSVKYNNNEANLADPKGSEKDDTIKGSSKDTSIPLQNQIVGRVGEIPIQNKFTTQIQSPIRTQGNNFGTSRQSKFDESTGNMQYIDTSNTYQQPPLINNYNSLPPLLNNGHDQTPLTVNTPEQFLINLNKQQQPLLANQQLPISANQQQLQKSIQALLHTNQQLLRNTNQQPLLNANQQPLLNANQQPLLNTNQQPVFRPSQHELLKNNPVSLLNNLQQAGVANVNRSPLSAFFSAIPADNTVASSSEQYVNTNSPASTLLQRLGSLGLNLGGGDLGGGGHSPQGLTFNLGPVPDPLSILLKLLSLVPRPLLDLNGRIFFGIELGKNAGLVSGVGVKPGLKPIG